MPGPKTKEPSFEAIVARLEEIAPGDEGDERTPPWDELAHGGDGSDPSSGVDRVQDAHAGHPHGGIGHFPRTGAGSGLPEAKSRYLESSVSRNITV